MNDISFNGRPESFPVDQDTRSSGDPFSAKRTRIELPLAKRTCGPCTACCVAYPLLPNEEFWPDGKRAYAPCKFLCDKGCSIHDQPRPSVCTGYECAYLQGIVPQRPSECGVIFNPTTANIFFQGNPLPQFPPDKYCIHMVETAPEAVLQLSSKQVRYWFRRIPWGMAGIQPYGVDPFQYPFRYRYWRDVAVFWKDDPDYATKVIDWWLTN